MPILVDSASRIVCYGFDVPEKLFALQQMLAYGSNILGCISPTRGGEEVLGRPIFSTVKEAKKKTNCNVVVVDTPPKYAGEAIIESVFADIELIVCLSKEVALHDMSEIRQVCTSSRLIGPGSVGVISPGQCTAGKMPAYIHTEGHCGILATAGTLMYEAAVQTSKAGVGQSTCVDIGASSMVEYLELFNRDPETKAILVVGSLQDTESLTRWTKTRAQKPVVAYVPGFQKKGDALFIQDPLRMGEAVMKALSY